MKFGVREICDVVLKAKSTQTIGNKEFKKGEPVIYFDTLKTSSMEGAATTVYAQGGRGNSRLVAWEGERTVTFTMEDALISPLGFMILSGAGLIEAGETDDRKIYVHATETIIKGSDGWNTGTYDPTAGGSGDGEANEPETVAEDGDDTSTAKDAIVINLGAEPYTQAVGGEDSLVYILVLDTEGEIASTAIAPNHVVGKVAYITDATNIALFNGATAILADYYVERTSGAQQINITPDKFGGNYYLEASTLFRTPNGDDLPAEFIIPNCKIQSNFTFTMASSGDPSSFSFTMDAFPDYTRFDLSKKVLAAIQIIEEAVE